ncbi:MAG: FtsQ-type POTRA domain-containing protein [Actinomycetota bacterium]|nr:FtsQ-type POTRA domain-containing protein [Actinomycetota bacterium]
MSRRPVASTSSVSTTRERPRAKARATVVSPRNGELVNDTTPRQRRRRRVWAVAMAAATVAILTSVVYAGQWVLHQSIFRVHHVSVTGEHHETLSQILTATHLDAHPAMIDLSQATLQHDLSIYPWVSSVSLIKRWPNSVQLAVHEMSAVAVAFDAHHVLRYVGADGRALSGAPISANFPTLVTSPSTLGAKSWPYQGPESAAALVASQLPEAFSAQVRQISVDALGRVTLQLTTPIKFYLGPATNLNAKFVAVASAIAHATFTPGDLVDVTTPNELSVTGPSSS